MDTKRYSSSVLTVSLMFLSLFNSIEAQEEKKNPYHDLRKMALEMDSKTLGLTELKSDIEVFGIVTDLGDIGGTATITTFKTGDTSIYFSSGRGFIGAGQYESVSNVTKKYIQKSNKYVSKGKLSEDVSLPNSEYTVFYLLTNKGRIRIEEKTSKLESMSSTYSELYSLVHEVIYRVRLKSE